MAETAEDMDSLQPALIPVARTLSLIPVGLKEAALDSPTFRATAIHFIAQFDVIENWLKDYVKQFTKLSDRFGALSQEFDGFRNFPLPPPADNTQAVLDHDYTLLATSRLCDGAKEYFQTVLRNIASSRTILVEPLNNFIKDELRVFKDAKDGLKRAQRDFDSELAKYASQGKTKESSSLREDAFKLHEARKNYLKASMDFCIQAPNFRASLDRVLVKVCSEQWKSFRASREASTATFNKWGSEMERIRGWSREMDDSEPVFKRELLIARRQIEESAEIVVRPSRELDDYAASTVPFLGSGTGAGAASLQSPTKLGNPTLDMPEKQGWLFLKSAPPKPARTTWPRRWFFVKNGIFGWLVNGYNSGGVEESEKIGVLLCSVRPAIQEERRFCFEVKTKDTTIILQAETQNELLQWLSAFDLAKRKALEDPASSETSPAAPGSDPAFAISPPVSPDFAARSSDGHMIQSVDDIASLGVPDAAALASRSSFDVVSSRRSTTLDGESSRERLLQRLDLHRKPTPQANAAASGGGGIASLISASHNILPVGPGSPKQTEHHRSFTVPTSSFAPSTLAQPPSATNLSERAVVVSGERGVDFSRADGSGTPSGIMANLWGSTNWSYTNRRIRDAMYPTITPHLMPKAVDDMGVMDGMHEPLKPELSGTDVPPVYGHRKTISAGNSLDLALPKAHPLDEPINDYPLALKADDALALKAHDAQFRVLFTGIPRSEKVVLVFTAMWNPNEQQEFPGRVYVTTQRIYFYSNHFGMVLITETSLSTIDEVTAAPGRENECDYLFLHTKKSPRRPESARITVKTFLTSLKLLQRRLDYLVRNANLETPASLEEVFKVFTKITAEDAETPSLESWEELGYSPGEETDVRQLKNKKGGLKTSLRIDGTLYGERSGRTGREVTRFKLPAQAVVYKPQGMGDATIVKDFGVSAKALFHVMFGDRSAVFQILYRHRPVENIVQNPWVQSAQGKYIRQFTCTVENSKETETDTQSIDVMNDHLCYVVTQSQAPWHLPLSKSFRLVTKFVITHSAKAKCKLAIFNNVVWQSEDGEVIKTLSISQRLVQKQALRDYKADAIDLTNVAADQVSKLGARSKTNKAMQIYGAVGQSTQTTQVTPSELPEASVPRTRKAVQQRTLMDLYQREALEETFRVFTMIIDLCISLAKSVAGVASGHKLLVGLLIASVAYNTWYGYRDGLTWYHERNAGKFMARLGVKSDATVSRAVYLSDIEELISMPALEDTLGNATGSGLSRDQGWNTCRGTFSDIIMSSDPEVAVASVGSTPKGSSKRAVARLQRTRLSLARYRHDLLVGMRVVNRVEEEVVQTEWEDWVKEEERKCRRVQGMLAEQKKKSGQQVLKDAEGEEEVLGEDFARYCDSCREEAALIA